MWKWMTLGVLAFVTGLAWGQQAIPGEYHEHALAVLGPDTWAVAAGRTAGSSPPGPTTPPSSCGT